MASPRYNRPAESLTLPRAPVYDLYLRDAVLAKLDHWDRLPEGDLLSMLTPVERLRFRPQVLRDLQAQGLITIAPIGDERVLGITYAGRQWLRRRGG